MIKEIDISELKAGHFVVDIVKQQGSYNLTSAGHIKNEDVIKNLCKRGVESILIDTNKTKVTKHNKKVTESHKAPALNDNKNIATPIIKEIKQAKKLFHQSKEIQKKVFEDAAHGRELNLAPVIEITNKTISTIFKNPDALACIINIRNKDEYLLEHSTSVSILTTIFAKYLKIDKQIIQQLAVGAFLHDVGKIMIPEKVLNKPSKLTEAEFGIMKTHVNHSIEIIKATPGISEISLEVAALHHEKLDSGGYPFNLPAEKISTYGRIITICDILDALTAHRIYKKGYPHIKAFAILRNLADDGQIDKRLVDLFIKCMGVYPVGSLVELNSNKLAIVEERNIEDPINPKVRCFYNAQHHKYTMTEDIDLSKSEDFINKGVKADDFDLNMNKVIEFLLMEG